MAHATSSVAKNMRRRQRRRRRHKPTKPTTTSWRRPELPVGPAGGVTTTSNVYDVPDHLLELILHRLDSPVCLVRAASACKRWCRVAADSEFLDGFRSRRVPLIAGHYRHTNNTRPVFVPTSPALSIHGRHDFSLDFVPNVDDTWTIRDVRDGLLVLSRRTPGRADVVVCEPLTRQYRQIPPLEYHEDWPCLGFYLLKDDVKSGIGLSTFKVVAVLLRRHLCDHRLGVPAAFVYSDSGTRRRGCWTRVECPWKTKINFRTSANKFTFAGRANGSLHWGVGGNRDGELLVLDEATKGVSQVKLPGDIQGMYDTTKFRIMEGEHGALRAVRAAHKDLKIFALLRGSDEWVLEGLLRFEDVTRGLPGRQDHHFQNGGARIVAAHETYLVMAPWVCSTWQFTVDLKTLAVEAVRDRIGTDWLEYPYQLPWPPALKYCS